MFCISCKKMFQLFHKRKSSNVEDESYVIVDRYGRGKIEIEAAELFGNRCRSNSREVEAKQNEENEYKETMFNEDSLEQEYVNDFICSCTECFSPRGSSWDLWETSIEGRGEIADEERTEEPVSFNASAINDTTKKIHRRSFSLNHMESSVYREDPLEVSTTTIGIGDDVIRVAEPRNSWLRCFYRFFGIVPTTTSMMPWQIPNEILAPLNEKYLLGRGAQAEVYVTTLRGELVAVKKFIRQSCLTEAAHLQKLYHRNIVQFFGLAGTDCLVMEYCRFGSLYDYLKRMRHSSGLWLPPRKLVDWASQIASGMSYLHRYRIVHRDLKSSNVLITFSLITNNYQLKISDFGISRQMPSNCESISSSSTKMSFAGTLAWMAPEVAREEHYSEKVDIWSFGVVLWELISLEQPYRDMDQGAIRYKVGRSVRLPSSSYLPRTIHNLLGRCCHREAAQRPTFKEIVRVLRLDVNRDLSSIAIERYYLLQNQWRLEIGHKLDQLAGLRGRRPPSPEI